MQPENTPSATCESLLQTLASLRAEVDQLRIAVDHRDLIGQAKGILMARYDVDADTAWALLRRLSSHSNVKLFEVASMVVEHRALPDDSQLSTGAASRRAHSGQQPPSGKDEQAVSQGRGVAADHQDG